MATRTIRYAIEASDGQPSQWRQVGEEYEALDKAEAEWNRLDDLYGYNTYHRLVEVKRKVLKEA